MHFKIIVAVTLAAISLSIGTLHAKTTLYYSIDLDGAINARIATFASDIQEESTRKNEAIRVSRGKDSQIFAAATKETDLQAFLKRMAKQYNDTMTLKKTGKRHITLRLQEGFKSKLRDQLAWSVTQVVEQRLRSSFRKGKDVGIVIEKRYVLRIELPQLSDKKLAEVKRRLTIMGSLEFRIADDEASLTLRAAKTLPNDSWITLENDEYSGKNRGSIKFGSLISKEREALAHFLDNLKGDLLPPPNREFLIGERWNDKSKKYEFLSYYLHRKPLLTGKHLKSVKVKLDEKTSMLDLLLTFNGEGAKALAALTLRYTGYRLAIILNGLVKSAPVIQTTINGGRARISLGNPQSLRAMVDEAYDLAAVLQVGALPARLTLIPNKNR